MKKMADGQDQAWAPANCSIWAVSPLRLFNPSPRKGTRELPGRSRSGDAFMRSREHGSNRKAVYYVHKGDGIVNNLCRAHERCTLRFNLV